MYHSLKTRKDTLKWLCDDFFIEKYPRPEDLLTAEARNEIYDEYCRIFRHWFSDAEFTRMFAPIYRSRMCNPQPQLIAK